jgi:RNA polymerase sigma-70 factor (ECF subfamily)
MDFDSLLKLARSGDREAKERLFARVRPILRAFLRRKVDNDNDASDLTQDAWVLMAGAFKRFRGETDVQFLAWGRRIAANVFCDFLARRRPPTGPLPDDVAGASNCPLSWLARAEDMARLREAIDELPEKYRVVIEGRLFEQLTPTELAGRLGWPRSTVSVYQMRAVAWLARRLRGTNR